MEPDGKPQAELWMGAHVAAPSAAQVGDRWVTLTELIGDDPEGMLGDDVVDRFGPRLPFLFKVLAAARPLSIQVHPNLVQARQGFVLEDVHAVPRRSPERTYRDRNHKPEVLCALTPFEMLSGFRPAAESAAILSELTSAGATLLQPFVAGLERAELSDVFWDLWSVGRSEATQLVDQVAKAVDTVPASSPFAAEVELAGRLAALHPGDIGVVVGLLLNRLVLQPGQAIYAPAGRIHAYIRGAGVELMANSDNVIRAGLTRKRVDLIELAHVLRVTPESVEPVLPRREGALDIYPTPTPDFQLARVGVKPASSVSATVFGPEILLCMRGKVTLGPLELGRGESAFVPANTGSYVLSGDGVLFRATVSPG